MSVDIQLPKINAPTTEGQVQQLSSYMYQLVDKLNWALNSGVDSGSSGVYKQYVKSASGNDVTLKEAQDTFNSIKSFIIKSAEIVEAYEESMTVKFNGHYVAQSDYGTFKETTTSAITANSADITQLYTDTETIETELANYKRDTAAYIKSGKLQDDPPVYGVEVGQTTTYEGQTTFDRFARFTAGGIYFYMPGYYSGEPVAYFNAGQLYIPHGNITGGSIDAGNITVTNLTADKISVGSTAPTGSVAAKLADLQSQLDGSIDTYYASGRPTLDNYPANAWTTTALKDAHIGDLYYDSDDNACFRWVYDSDDLSYKWVTVTDTGVAAAMARANDAYDLAGRKRTIYYGDPPVGTTINTGDMKIVTDATTNRKVTKVYDGSAWVDAAEYDLAITAAITGLETSMAAGTTTINGGCITTNSIHANQLVLSELVVGDTIAMGDNASISWDQVTSQPTIPTTTDIEEIVEDYGYQTESDVEGIVEGYGYQTSSDVTSAISSSTGALYVAVTPLFYMKIADTTTAYPAAPTSEVESVSTAANQWTTVVPSRPQDNNNYLLYTCTQKKTKSGTVTWTPVILYMDAAGGTQITKEAVTTTYVNALNVTAHTLVANATLANKVTANDLDITGGSVRIESGDQSFSYITLSTPELSSGTVSTNMGTTSFTVLKKDSNSVIRKMADYGQSGFILYEMDSSGNTITPPVASIAGSVSGSVSGTHVGNLYLSNRDNSQLLKESADEIALTEYSNNWANGTKRAALNSSGLTFKDSNNGTQAVYPSGLSDNITTSVNGTCLQIPGTKMAIQTVRASVTTTYSNRWGNLYETPKIDLPSWNKSFKSGTDPYVTYSANLASGGSLGCMIENVVKADRISAGSVALIRGTADTETRVWAITATAFGEID